jgi:hypothetical protein
MVGGMCQRFRFCCFLMVFDVRAQGVNFEQHTDFSSKWLTIQNICLMPV